MKNNNTIKPKLNIPKGAELLIYGEWHKIGIRGYLFVFRYGDWIRSLKDMDIFLKIKGDRLFSQGCDIEENGGYTRDINDHEIDIGKPCFCNRPKKVISIGRLTRSDIELIISSNRTSVQLASEFGVTRQFINNIIKNYRLNDNILVFEGG